MRRYLRIAAAALSLVGFVAVASYLTTGIRWVGGFPQGEFRITVRDPVGKPVEGAVLRVYHGGTRKLAFKNPLDNHLIGSELVSDEDGRITAIRESGRHQFGGDAWQLFWLIPMGAKSPKYDCEITAEGFKPFRFRLNRLFETPHVSYEEFPKTKLTADGREIELPVYQHSFTLTAKKKGR